MMPNMTDACVFLPLAPAITVRSVRAMPPLSPEVEADVDAIWEGARSTNPKLFNGRVFTADTVDADRIEGHWTEFRRVFAQMRAPHLFGALALRPLAVVGVLQTPDGVVVGQRSLDAIYQAGRWQTCPAGSVESREGEELVDLEAQVLAEAEEELGIEAAMIKVGRTLVAVEHPGTHIIDVAIALGTDLRLPDILTFWQNCANREYVTLEVLPPDGVQAALQDGRLTEQTRIFLSHA